jgi:hypothetical protein
LSIPSADKPTANNWQVDEISDRVKKTLEVAWLLSFIGESPSFIGFLKYFSASEKSVRRP